MDKILKKGPNGEIQEFIPISVSSGAADGGKTLVTNDQGVIDPTFLPPGVTPDLDVFIAFEGINAGDFVNIFDDSGTASVRKADGSTSIKKAHAYVLDTVISGVLVKVYYDDKNNAVTGLTPGVEQFLSATVPGKTTETEPNTPGFISQKLGIASSASSMHVRIGAPIILA